MLHAILQKVFQSIGPSYFVITLDNFADSPDMWALIRSLKTPW